MRGEGKKRARARARASWVLGRRIHGRAIQGGAGYIQRVSSGHDARNSALSPFGRRDGRSRARPHSLYWGHSAHSTLASFHVWDNPPDCKLCFNCNTAGLLKTNTSPKLCFCSSRDPAGQSRHDVILRGGLISPESEGERGRWY